MANSKNELEQFPAELWDSTRPRSIAGPFFFVNFILLDLMANVFKNLRGLGDLKG